MNLNSLLYFVEVARTLNFTEASKNLYVSQPGISQQIHLLEKQLNVKLLNRTTRKVELTKVGKYLYDKISPSLTEILTTVSQLENAKLFPRLIKIATIPSAASLYLPNLLKKVHDKYPETEFNIKETTSAEAIQLIKDGNFHLGFIRITDDLKIDHENGIKYLEIQTSPIKAIVSSKHPLANEKEIDLEQLKNDYFLHYDPKHSTALYEILEESCYNAGFKPKTLCTGSELLTISHIVSHNLGVTIIPEDMLSLMTKDNIKVLNIKNIQMESTIAAIWQNDEYLDPSTQIIINILQEFNKKFR